MSPLTSFLVLETEADYERFGLNRRGLKGILTVGLDGLVLLERNDAWWQGVVARKRKRDGEKSFSGDTALGRASGDRDSDGIPDQADSCPDIGVSGDATLVDDDGCPVRARVVTQSSEIRILQPIQFYPGSSQLHTSALPILDEVASLMREQQD